MSRLVNKKRCTNLAWGHLFLAPAIKMQTVSATSKFHPCSGQKNQSSGNLRLAQVTGKNDHLLLMARGIVFVCLFVHSFLLLRDEDA